MKTVVIEVKRSWNGTIEGAYISGQYVWDYQVEDVIQDYKKGGYKVVLKEKQDKVKGRR